MDWLPAFAGMTALLFTVSLASAASRPKLLLDAEHLNFIRAKAASNTPDWVRLRNHCDALANYPVTYPNLYGDTSSNYVPNTGTGFPYIHAGYAGSEYLTTMYQLGACYQAIKNTDTTRAANYFKKVQQVMSAMSEPSPTITRAGDGAVFVTYLNATAADLPLNFLAYQTDLKVGDVVNIAGFTGCTSANGTWTIDTITPRFATVKDPTDQRDPVTNAPCTNKAYISMQDGSYATRYYGPALALGYDWFYDLYTPQERSRYLNRLNWTLKGYVTMNPVRPHPEDNYQSGFFWALVAADIATEDDNDPVTRDWIKAQIRVLFEGSGKMRDYKNRWLAGGGFGEGWQAYGYNATRAILQAMMAMKVHGVDWSQAPYNFHFLDGTLKYWMQFVSPNKLALDEQEYVYRIGVPDPVFVPLSHAVFFTYMARRFQRPIAAQFQNWYLVVSAKQKQAAGTRVPPWERDKTSPYTTAPSLEDQFLYEDLTAASQDFTTLPLMYRGWSGNLAITRSDWGDNAVALTFNGGPSLGAAGNGKTQFISGALSIQRGNEPFVVMGLAESARSYDLLSVSDHNQLHNERSPYENRKNSTFYADRPGGKRGVQGLPAKVEIPGRTHTVQTHPTQIDRSEDFPDHTYFRSVHLESVYSISATDSKYHTAGWTREVLFIRPKVVVVHDRTKVLYPDDDRAMFWTFGRNLTEVSVGAGLKRFRSERNSVHRGQLTLVLPQAMNTTIVNHSNPAVQSGNPLGFLFRVESRPPVLDHTDDTWLAVIDAADQASLVENVYPLTATNLDAIQLASSGIVGFLPGDMPLFPIRYTFTGNAQVSHRLAGFDPNKAYSVDRSVPGLIVIDAAKSDGMDIIATPAGLLLFGAVGVPPARPVLTVNSPILGTVNQPFYYQIQASGNPDSYGVAGLPAAMSVNSLSGMVSGIPAQVGDFPVTFSATNGGGTGQANAILRISTSTPAPPPPPPPPPPPTSPPPSETLPTPQMNFPAMMSLQDELHFDYPRGDVEFEWTFTPVSSLGTALKKPLGVPSTVSTRTPRSSLTPVSEGLVAGTYDISVKAILGQQQSASVGGRVSFASADLNAVRVYPNPWRSDRHTGDITFDNLSLGSTIKIFNTAGHLVRELGTRDTGLGTARWDRKNDKGDKVASGIYIFLIKDGSGGERKGKLAIVK